MKPLNHNHHQIQPEFKLVNGLIAGKNPKQTDIELTTIQPNSYTSLRDIIAINGGAGAGAASPMNYPASPTCRKSTPDDVPIRNPLLKQAAMAYLQPLGSPRPAIDGRSWPERVKASLNRCLAGDGERGGVGCWGPLDGVVLAQIKEFWARMVRAIWTVENRDDHVD